MRSLFLPRSSGSRIKELGWSLKTKRALPNFSVRTGNSTQTPSYRLTRFFCVVIVWLPNGHFEPRWSSLFTAGSHAKFRSRCMGFHRTDGEREDYGLDGLLRWTDLTAHRFGCALRGMGRTLNGCGPQRPRNDPCPLTGLDIAIRLWKKNDEN